MLNQFILKKCTISFLIMLILAGCGANDKDNQSITQNNNQDVVLKQDDITTDDDKVQDDIITDDDKVQESDI